VLEVVSVSVIEPRSRTIPEPVSPTTELYEAAALDADVAADVADVAAALALSAAAVADAAADVV
jgi:hypothetical protein